MRSISVIILLAVLLVYAQSLKTDGSTDVQNQMEADSGASGVAASACGRSKATVRQSEQAQAAVKAPQTKKFTQTPDMTVISITAVALIGIVMIGVIAISWSLRDEPLLVRS
eukprot:gnl/TRDRNA2_/TRDRNA2_182367_c0_seq1.p1 gnl/TRDRNA2_/TRDRNA2_182367_c0~~gnl/TRDRNA2_/TRDRNA2_182367_c0_seq1.p1  ORF type:complete len:112 (-),score=19.04 gnl/TRDRNA2_/TRDRNA2_182367_c0_seq1:120-455(-)